MNVYLAGGLLAVGIALYIIGFRGLLGPSSRRGSPRSAGRATAVAWAACVCAVAATGLLAVVPVGVSETVSQGGGVVRSRRTLVAIEGYGVLPVLVAPVVITALVALTRRPVLRIALAAMFDALCFSALLSIGAFYIPAAIALTIAAFRTPRSRRGRPARSSAGCRGRFGRHSRQWGRDTPSPQG